MPDSLGTRGVSPIYKLNQTSWITHQLVSDTVLPVGTPINIDANGKAVWADKDDARQFVGIVTVANTANGEPVTAILRAVAVIKCKVQASETVTAGDSVSIQSSASVSAGDGYVYVNTAASEEQVFGTALTGGTNMAIVYVAVSSEGAVGPQGPAGA